ncbi:hypothetical protein BJ742DRAFT_858634 [Cladochytrium replicatum]|nr:hypothetical protein BJ742DRAFT_858634 [Cladochytrium replicatum]
MAMGTNAGARAGSGEPQMIEDEEGRAVDFTFSVAVIGSHSACQKQLVSMECGDSGIGSATNVRKEADTSIVIKSRIYSFPNYVCRVDYWVSTFNPRTFARAARCLSGAAATMFVFNVDDRESFDIIRNWLSEMDRDAPSLGKDFPLPKRYHVAMPTYFRTPRVLIGHVIEDGVEPGKVGKEMDGGASAQSKGWFARPVVEEIANQKAGMARSTTVHHKREVTVEEACRLANENGLEYSEVRSDDSDARRRVFLDLVRTIFKNIPSITNPLLRQRNIGTPATALATSTTPSTPAPPKIPGAYPPENPAASSSPTTSPAMSPQPSSRHIQPHNVHTSQLIRARNMRPLNMAHFDDPTLAMMVRLRIHPARPLALRDRIRYAMRVAEENANIKGRGATSDVVDWI